jgi:hypothetical protein
LIGHFNDRLDETNERQIGYSRSPASIKKKQGYTNISDLYDASSISLSA